MPLLLKRVETARGVRWLVDAFRLYARRPMAFTMMFVVFYAAAFVVSQVPLVGGLLVAASLPMLSLGFMVASQSALLDGPVRLGQFSEPLRGDVKRRRALLTLCLAFAAGAAAILLLCDAVSSGATQRLGALIGRGNVTPEEMDALMSEPGVSFAVLLFALLCPALSVPFWHAPALVHWGAQSVGQALFSSTLAVWRSKGAFLLYGLAWLSVVFGFGLVAALLFGLLGLGQYTPLLAVPATLLFSTMFYVSLLFTFNDSFGSTEVPPVSPTV